MSKFSNDDDFNQASYVSVNARLKKFREDFPEGSVQTSRIAEEGGIIFKCLVFRNHKEVELYSTAKVAAASGHAYLPDWAREDEQKVEEYAETVSIGRALACLGYSADKFASSEEMDQYNRLHGEEEPEEEVEEEDEKPRRSRSRKASKKDSEESDEEEPKLRSSRRINRSSKLSGRKRKSKSKGD